MIRRPGLTRFLEKEKEDMSEKRYRPLAYFIATFIVTFAFWFAGAYVSFREGGSDIYLAFMLPGLLAPFVISLVMTLRSGDGRMKRDFVERLVDPRLIRPATLPFIFLMTPVAVLAAIAISMLLGGSAAELRLAEGFSFTYGLAPALLVLLLAATFEELGWRGYAFDSLESRFGFLKASILFGVLWSLWHMPLLFVKGSYQYEIMQENPWFAVNFFVSVVPLGVIVSWVCVRNLKSVLAAILFHFVINMSQEMFAITQATKCIETGVFMAIAAVLVFVDRRLFFPAGRGEDRADTKGDPHV